MQMHVTLLEIVQTLNREIHCLMYLRKMFDEEDDPFLVWIY